MALSTFFVRSYNMRHFLAKFSAQPSPMRLLLTSAAITSLLFWDPSFKKEKQDAEVPFIASSHPTDERLPAITPTAYVETPSISPSVSSKEDAPTQPLEQLLFTDRLIAQLMSIADRFVCATEMA